MARATKALSRAKALIQEKISELTTDQAKDMLCALFGHPPVVNSCMGELTCARCGAIVGDALMKGSDVTNTAIIGHDCPACTRIIGELTEEQRLLTTLE